MIYELTDEQGRTLSIEGDQPPTEQEVEGMFAQAFPDFSPTAQESPEPSFLEGIKQAPTDLKQRLGEVGQGLSQFTREDWKDLAGYAALGAEKVASGATLGGYDWLQEKLGGNMAEREAAYKQEAQLAGVPSIVSGASTFVPEIGGSIAGLGGGIYKGLQGLGAKGLGLAAGTGGLTGGVQAFNESRGDLGTAGMGAAGGAILGAGLYGTGKLAQKGMTAIKKASMGQEARTIEKLRSSVGDDGLRNAMMEAQATGRPLIDVADDALTQKATQAKLRSPEARATLVNKAQRTSIEAPAETRAVIDKALGSTSRTENIDDIQRVYQTKAAPLYEQALKVEVPDQKFSVLVADENIMEAINKAGRRQGIASDVPVNSMERLDAAKRYLDDEISVAIRAGRNSESRVLQQAKSKLVDTLDEVSPSYAQARQVSSDRFKLEEAQNMAKDIFSNKVSPERFTNNIQNLNQAELDSLKVGIRGEITDLLGSRANEAVSLGRIMPQNTQDKMRAALGDKNANKLIEYAKAEIKRNRAMNKILEGSQTAEKNILSELPMSSQGLVRSVGNIIPQLSGQRNANQLATFLTQPPSPTMLGSLQNLQKLDNVGKMPSLFPIVGGLYGGNTADNLKRNR